MEFLAFPQGEKMQKNALSQENFSSMQEKKYTKNIFFFLGFLLNKSGKNCSLAEKSDIFVITDGRL